MEASESVAKLSQDLAVKEKELALASVKADKVSTSQRSPAFEFSLICLPPVGAATLKIGTLYPAGCVCEWEWTRRLQKWKEI